MTNTITDAMTLPMLGLMALDELRRAATQRTSEQAGDPAVPVRGVFRVTAAVVN